jgi:hypothetical protein
MLKNVTLGDLTRPDNVERLEGMLRELYLLANKPEITDTDPNGSLEGDKGQLVWYDNAGTLTLKKNTDGDTAWANA